MNSNTAHVSAEAIVSRGWQLRKTTTSTRTYEGIRSKDDGLNQEIIKLLEVDGRMAFKEIAQQLGVSEGTIRNRVSGLRSNNQLRIVAMSDPIAGEYTTDAMIGINVSSGVTPRMVADRLNDDPRVVFILWVAGQYDLIIEIVSDSSEALKEFLENEIHAHDDISDADVMLGIVNFKNQFLLKRDKHQYGVDSSAPPNAQEPD